MEFVLPHRLSEHSNIKGINPGGGGGGGEGSGPADCLVCAEQVRKYWDRHRPSAAWLVCINTKHIKAGSYFSSWLPPFGHLCEYGELDAFSGAGRDVLGGWRMRGRAYSFL